MFFKKSVLILSGIFLTFGSIAQNKGDLTQSRILILLDGSSSMIHKWAEGKEKFKAASTLIMKLMDSVYTVNDQVEFSLRVFGHQHTLDENFCYDTKNEVPFAKDNKIQMSLRLDALHPLGVTPIAYALEQAAQYDLVDEAHNAYSIILITDGGESCGGDICEVMRTLIKNKVYFKPYILSLENDPGLRNTYACMGDYLQVTKSGDIVNAVGTIVNAFHPMLKLTPSEYKQIQTDVAKRKPEDTISKNVVKAFKTDSVAATPARPAADKIAKLSVHPLRHFPIDRSDVNIPQITVAGELPPMARETPPPVRISGISARHLIPFPVNKNLDVPVDLREPDTALPPLPKEMPAALKIALVALRKPIPFPVKPDPEVPVNAMEPYSGLPPVPTEAPAPAKIARLSLRHFIPMPATGTTDITLNTIEQDSELPPIEKEVPAAAKITGISPRKIKPLPVKPNTAVTLSPIEPDNTLPPVNDLLPAAEKPGPARITLTRLKPAALKKIQLLIIIDERTPPSWPMPELPKLKPEQITKNGKTSAPIPDKSVVPPAKKAETKVETEDAKETTVQVYFTNGKGKFYQSTPQVVLVDPVTNQDVKKFFRFIDADGNPDPQKDIVPGVYNLTFSTKRTLIAPNVTIEKNKNNKIYVTVKNTNLSFHYTNAPNRPVTEFVAVVTQRNRAQGRIQTQKCTEEMEYEPENYHIEINTFPRDVRNVDLEFDLETPINILQPGFLKFTNEINAGSVLLYLRDGDKYLQFCNWDLSNPRSGHLQIQPGEYQAHYQKGPGRTYAPETVIPFIIRSTEVTEVIIK